MFVRLLTPSDAVLFQSLRLAGLAECSASFASSYEEEVNFSAEYVEHQLATNENRGVFGSFEGSRLIGIAGLRREDLRKLNHKAFVWGVYVAPDMRGRGVSRRLLSELLGFAQRSKGITMLNLTVNANNAAAINLYAALGFKQFGLERNSLLVGNFFYDEIHMSLQLEGSHM